MDKGKEPKGRSPFGSKHSRKGAGLAACVAEINRALASAAWHIHKDICGVRQDSARAFTLDLKVVIQPGSLWRLAADPSVEEQIRTAVRDMASRAEVYRSGRVYCYRCESSDCPHSIPPWPTSVFGGYSSTGVPQWPDVGQVLLNLRHPEVDLLYRHPGRDALAAYIDPEALKHHQLDVFGRQSKTYDILGQIVFGFLYLTPPCANHKAPERVALTLQAVESRHLDGSPRLEMNVIGQFVDGSPAIDALAESYQLRILNIISDARRRIGHLASSSYGKGSSPRVPADYTSRVADILKGTVRALERLGRQKERRTIHAEERRVANRPTSQALADAVASPDNNVLWDDHRNTVVVLGPRNRIHIFSEQGRHITSMSLEAEAVRNRRRRLRWHQLTGDRLERFRAAVVKSGNLRSS